MNEALVLKLILGKDFNLRELINSDLIQYSDLIARNKPAKQAEAVFENQIISVQFR
jgi:hypothetical protein